MQTPDEGSGQTLRRTLRQDLIRGDFWRTVKRDYRALREYSLEDDPHRRHARLSHWRILRAMVLKLTPARRILVLAGMVILIITGSVSGDNVQIQPWLGGVFLLFVLLLELKDRLLAQDELNAGRAVQRALLPPKNPVVVGWSIHISTWSANEVGGDLVDYLALGKDRVGVVIADVSGKGLLAALQMAKLQTILRTLAPDCGDLSTLAGKINGAFRREVLSNVFASMVYIELTPGSGLLRYFNAGHPPPLVLRSGAVVETDKGNAALGLLDGPAFTERRIELGKGDSFVCYSDGLTEARNVPGEFFGLDRLISLLRTPGQHDARGIAGELESAVDRFAGDVDPHDDLSLLVLQRS